MNFLKEIILNQLIRIPAVKVQAKKHHETGISNHPEVVEEYYRFLTEHTPVKGKKILELGPGKTTDIILRAKADGALAIAIIDIEPYLTDQQVSENNIDYRIYDGRDLPFPDNSFDSIWSTSVYEHVRFPDITVNETYRLLRPGGRVVHMIDLVDHFFYATNDQEAIFNCLKYSQRMWEVMTWNRSAYVNRLRASDWVSLHKSAGFKIISKDCDTSDFIRDNYKTNPNLKYLLKYSESDAISTRICLVAEK